MNAASNLLHDSSAYLLVIHGSRDPRYQQATHQLTDLIRQQLLDDWRNRPREEEKTDSKPFLATASLEFADLPLFQKIVQIAQEALKRGFSRLEIIPLFLLPGVHVTQDIPESVADAAKNLKNTISLEIAPYLGSYATLTTLLSQNITALSADQRILLSHGSRRESANDIIEQIAKKINAIPAYWSVEPDLSQIVTDIAQKEFKNIVIIPYFLFTGGITDAIAQQVQDLQAQFPHLCLRLESPLGATPEFAQLIINSAIKRENTSVSR